jgi:pilus assembly protein CpaB
MRASTILSFVVALVLAVIAVFGARNWLAQQQQALTDAASGAQQDTTPQNSIVIAKAPLRFGERLTAEKLELLEWPSDRLPPGAFTSIEALVGVGEEQARFVMQSMDVGEPVLASRTTEPGERAKLSAAITPGLKAVSIGINDVLGVAGFVLPGDRVDVMLTRSAGDGGVFVDVLLQGVRVLAIDQTADDMRDQPSVVRTVTFEVSTEEAQKLTLGAAVGTLSLALRNVVSTEVENIERVTVADISEGAASETLSEQQMAAAEALLAEQNARIAAMEEQLRQQGQTPAQPVVVEKIVEVMVEPPEPEFVTVGVIRGGARSEYRVGITAGAAQ